MTFFENGWFEWYGVKDVVHDVDKTVGARIRYYRTSSGESEEAIAQLLRLKPRDIRKLEQGTKRVSASGLFALAKRFHISVSAFFRPMDCIL